MHLNGGLVGELVVIQRLAVTELLSSTYQLKEVIRRGGERKGREGRGGERKKRRKRAYLLELGVDTSGTLEFVLEGSNGHGCVGINVD